MKENEVARESHGRELFAPGWVYELRWSFVRSPGAAPARKPGPWASMYPSKKLATEASERLPEGSRWSIKEAKLPPLARRLRIALSDYLRTPAGGWPETEQAWGELVEELWRPGQVDLAAAAEHAGRIAELAVAAGAECHASRRE